MISRRKLLKTVPATAAVTIAGVSLSVKAAVIPVTFDHGVASGDPLQDRVIIWTRINPVEVRYSGDVSVEWQVSENENFERVVKAGFLNTSTDRDYTVKVDVTGLSAGKKYFYRFIVGDVMSPIGETRTLGAAGINEINLAVVSCSNYPWGYFNGYRSIAESGPFDAVIHLGDYIYEYEVGVYQSPNAEKMGRLVDPPHEIKTVDDYRRRYALYRADEDLQEIHRKYPFICAWDDHEFSNNAYATGAQNHQPNEGEWNIRRRAATKVYLEWMPVRVTDSNLPTVRSFNFGKLATLAMLDTRVVGRERPLEYGRDVTMLTVNGKEIPDYKEFHRRLETEERSLLGKEQEEWLSKTLSKSSSDGIPWQILGQQIIMSYRPEPPLSNVFTADEIKDFPAGEQLSMYVAEHHGGFYNPDAWDGYQPARRRVFDMFEKYPGNPIVLTGDTHCGWGMSLTDKMNGKHYGAEFGVQGITSPGRGDRIHKVEEVEQAYYDFLPHMAYASIRGRGYMTLKITENDTVASWYILSTIENKDFTVSKRKSLKYSVGDSADGKVTLKDVT